MGVNIPLFVKSKFSKAQLIDFFLPIHTPGVLLIKDGYASMHIPIYTSYEIITSYTSHGNIQFLSLGKLNEMKVVNTSLGNPEEKNRTPCLKSIANILHINSYCWRKPSEILPPILPQSLCVVSAPLQRRGSLE